MRRYSERASAARETTPADCEEIVARLDRGVDHPVERHTEEGQIEREKDDASDGNTQGSRTRDRTAASHMSALP